MTGPILYGCARSRATRNLWLAEEAGIDLPVVPVIQSYRLADPLAAEAPLNTASPAFLAMAPAGQIPVLKDGDLVLAESMAINLYLARHHGGDLGPRDAAEEALMLQWTLFAAGTVEPAAYRILAPHMAGTQGTPEGQAELAAGAAALQRPFGHLDRHLAGAGQMVGGRFTVADINVAETVRYAAGIATILDPFPALGAWYHACQAREGFRRMWARREAEA